MRLQNPEIRRAGAAFALVLALAATACGSDRSQEGEGSSATVEGSAVARPDIQFPGRLALSGECPEWTAETKGDALLLKSTDGTSKLLTVIDARLADPPECDPERDWGAGPQQGASVTAANIDLPADPYYKTVGGADYIKDGVVAEVVGYAEGERACHANGQNDSTEWYLVKARPEHPAGWVARTLLDPRFLPTTTQLEDAGIPKDAKQGQYVGTAQGGC